MRRQSNWRYTTSPSTAVYTTPTVDTSVAVAMPRTTKKRITKGSVRPGTAIRNVRSITPAEARTRSPTSSDRERHHATTTRAIAATNAGNRPPVNNAEIETFVTDPMVISTRLGGIVSDIALDVASSAASSPGC